MMFSINCPTIRPAGRRFQPPSPVVVILAASDPTYTAIHWKSLFTRQGTSGSNENNTVDDRAFPVAGSVTRLDYFLHGVLD